MVLFWQGRDAWRSSPRLTCWYSGTRTVHCTRMHHGLTCRGISAAFHISIHVEPMKNTRTLDNSTASPVSNTSPKYIGSLSWPKHASSLVNPKHGHDTKKLWNLMGKSLDSWVPGGAGWMDTKLHLSVFVNICLNKNCKKCVLFGYPSSFFSNNRFAFKLLMLRFIQTFPKSAKLFGILAASNKNCLANRQDRPIKLHSEHYQQNSSAVKQH